MSEEAIFEIIFEGNLDSVRDNQCTQLAIGINGTFSVSIFSTHRNYVLDMFFAYNLYLHCLRKLREIIIDSNSVASVFQIYLTCRRF